MKIEIHGHFKLDSVNKILKKRGLEEHGNVQKFIDSEVLRRCDPYIPKDTGALIASGITATRIGSGLVIWNTPYARRQYYENAGKSGGLRGKHWFSRMKIDQGQQIIDGAIKLAGGKR
jgi:hypothetical protein